MLADFISTFTRMAPYKYVGQSLPCNLCGAGERIVIGRRDRYGNKLTTALCLKCGLVFTDPMPTEEEVNRYYARSYRKHYHNARKPRKKSILRAFRGAEWRYNLLQPFLSKGDKIVDVGAGGGEFVSCLQEHGFDVLGLEPDPGFARYAAKTYNVTIIEGTWQTAEIAEGSLDLITAHHVIEHFHNPLAALREFHKWLKPDGHLYISVPNIHDPKKTPCSRFHFAHVYNFTPQTLQMMALKAGFTPVKSMSAKGTTLVLEKRERLTEHWIKFPEHAQTLKTFFETYTNSRYFLTPAPYTRWCKRMWRLSTDRVRATFMKNPARG